MKSAMGENLDINSIIRFASSGDEESFGILVERFSPYLKKIIASYNISDNDKDDAWQEGLIGLSRAVELYDSELSSFSTFAYICMKSGVLSWLRKGKKHCEIPLESGYLEETASPESEPEKKVIGEEEKDAILKKIESELSPFETEVLFFSAAGEDSETIAKKLGKTKKSVDNALFRSREKVRRLIKV